MTDADERGLSRLVDSHPEPAALFGARGVLLAMNRGFACELGLPPSAAGHVTLAELVQAPRRECREMLREALQSTEPRPMRLAFFPVAQRSWQARCVAWRCNLDRSAGVMVRLSGDSDSPDRFLTLTRSVDTLNRECAARRRSEDQLRAVLLRLQESEEIKQHMMRQISHDLRTPLNAILGLSEFILLKPFGELDPGYADYIANIHHSGNELLELVDKVLQLTQSEYDRTVAREALSDLATCLESCIKVVTPLAEQKGLQLMIPESLSLPRLKVESVLIKQLIYNLLSNAIKYSDEGGSVRIAVDWRDEGLQVSVIDSGKGIERKELKRILEPFYRSGDAFHLRAQGSGLGLALTKQTIEILGGDLEIDSTPGHGTNASIFFPPQLIASGPDAEARPKA